MVRLLEQLAVLVEHAGDVGEQQQALGLHARGERAGERVGVDVEGLALAADGHRRDHRDHVGGRDHLDDVRIDLGGIADVADVDRLHQVRFRVRHLGDLAGDHQVGVLAGDADRLAALPVDGRDDILVDEARQHHLDHLDGGLVGDAQAVHELALEREPLQHAGDLRAAAVHDDGVHARLLEEHDVLGEGRRQGRVAHGVAAVLDHHGLPVVALHVRQGLGEDARLQVRGGRRRRFACRHCPLLLCHCLVPLTRLAPPGRLQPPPRRALGVKHL